MREGLVVNKKTKASTVGFQANNCDKDSRDRKIQARAIVYNSSPRNLLAFLLTHKNGGYCTCILC